MKGVIFCLLFFYCFADLWAADLAEEFTLHNVYTSHMVLQRNREIRISGTAFPGKSVYVSFAGKNRTAEAKQDGVWQATFPAMQAGGPYSMKISGKGVCRTLNDIFIGDVWICAGQSNMAFALRSNTEAKAEIATAGRFPAIRLLYVARGTSFGKKMPDVVSAGWQICTPQSVADFSALGYFWGRDLHREIGVPIGLINANYGGTPIESWMEQEAFLRIHLPDFARSAAGKPALDYAAILQKKGQALLKWEEKFVKDHAKYKEKAASWKNKEISEPEKWQNISIPSHFTHARIYRNGVIWLRRDVDVPPELAGQDLTLSLGPIDNYDETYFNGVKVGGMGNDIAKAWWTPRIYQVPGNLVVPGQNSIAIRVTHRIGPGGLYGIPEQIYLAREPHRIPLAGDSWKMRIEFLVAPNYPSRPDYPFDSSICHPSGLYNAMIAGLQRYPVRGVLWYQGEGNVHNPRRYASTFPELIRSWRRAWNDPELFFLFVQISSLEKHAPKQKTLTEEFYKQLKPRESNWAELREAQGTALYLPHTAMVVSTDLGNPLDIHPADKRPLAKRLVEAALYRVYNRKTFGTGPVYSKIKIEGDRIRVTFENTGSGLVAKGGVLRRFAVAGEDGVFYWADASIEGNDVIVHSAMVPAPLVVRYAWDNNPIDANLFNKEGFPASGFRSDIPVYLQNIILSMKVDDE